MEYVKSKELSKARRVLKSVVMKSAECSVPSADSETLAKQSGNIIIQRAITQAEEIKKKAVDETSAVHEKARKDGFAQGQVEAKKRYEILLKAMSSALDAMEGMRHEMAENLRENIIALAMEMAARVMKDEIIQDPSILKTVAIDILTKIAPAHEVTIKFNQSDFEVLKDFRSELESCAGFPDKFRMTHDIELGRGDVIVQYERGTIDARITTQLENIARSLMECQ